LSVRKNLLLQVLDGIVAFDEIVLEFRQNFHAFLGVFTLILVSRIALPYSFLQLYTILLQMLLEIMFNVLT